MLWIAEVLQGVQTVSQQPAMPKHKPPEEQTDLKQLTLSKVKNIKRKNGYTFF